MIEITLTDETAPRIRPLHGMNLAAPIINESISKKVSEELGRLNIPLTRLHDSPLDNPGMRLVDIPCVFPNPNADADDLKNYYFDQTDDYIENALNYGTRIMYRLGTSIEHSARHYWTKPPADLEKWCKICLRVIEHYTNVEYWEIGNECDEEIPQLWDGTWREFIQMYIATARRIKQRFPKLKVGGPSMARLNNHDGKYVREFLAACRDEKAPLDFFSWHQYSDKPQKMIAAPHEMKALLDEHGFSQTELHIAEWHYHLGWGSACTPERQQRLFMEMIGPDAAAYVGAVLSGWQATPITMGEDYTGSILAGYSGYALFLPGAIRTACYFTFEHFNRLTKLDHALSLTSSDETTWALGAMAGKQLLIMLSSFKTPQNDVTVKVGEHKLNPSTSRIMMLDQVGEPHHVDRDIRWEPHQLTIEKTSGSAVIVLELEVD